MLRICIQEPLLKQIIVLLRTLSAYSSLFVRYKFYSSDPGNVCVQAEGIVKPMKTLLLTQHHF